MSELSCARCGRPALCRRVEAVSGYITPLCESCCRYNPLRLLVLLTALAVAMACFL